MQDEAMADVDSGTSLNPDEFANTDEAKGNVNRDKKF